MTAVVFSVHFYNREKVDQVNVDNMVKLIIYSFLPMFFTTPCEMSERLTWNEKYSSCWS